MAYKVLTQDKKIGAVEFRKRRHKGKLVGQKSPLRLSEIWAIRVRLEIYERVRDLALFKFAIDSKLRGCDLVQLRLRDVANGGRGRTKNLRAVQLLLGQLVSRAQSDT